MIQSCWFSYHLFRMLDHHFNPSNCTRVTWLQSSKLVVSRHVHMKFLFSPFDSSLEMIPAAAAKDNWGCVTPLSRLNASTWGWLSSINWLNELQERGNMYASMFSCVSCVCVHDLHFFVSEHSSASIVSFFSVFLVQVDVHQMQIGVPQVTPG